MRAFHVRARTLLAALALVSLPASSPAAEQPAPKKTTDEEYQRRIEQLEKDLHQLKKDTRQLEVTNEEQAKLKPVAGYQDGFFVQTQDGNYKLKVGGYTQFDGRFFIDNVKDSSQFTFRRVRPELAGTVAKYFDFRLLPDFQGGRTQLFDAYVEAKYIPEAKLRVGKFKPPVGIERLQSATTLLFAERALPTNLVPSRDLGVQVGGDLWLGVFSYALGIFNGVADNINPSDVDVYDDKDFAGRIFAQPFKQTALEPLRGLGIGVAGTYGDQKGTPSSPDLPQYKTFGQSTFFSYRTDSPATSTGTAIADGARYRISPQGYYYFGPFGFLAEYVRSTQDVRIDTKVSDTDTTPVDGSVANSAWQVRAEYVLTGEDATYKGVAPAKPFDLWQGTWGAFEIGARYGELTVDGDAFDLGFADPKKSARRAKEFVLGANWFLNRNIMVALDWSRTEFTGGASNGNRTTEDVLLSRVQLVL